MKHPSLGTGCCLAAGFGRLRSSWLKDGQILEWEGKWLYFGAPGGANSQTKGRCRVEFKKAR